MGHENESRSKPSQEAAEKAVDQLLKEWLERHGREFIATKSVKLTAWREVAISLWLQLNRQGPPNCLTVVPADRTVIEKFLRTGP
jgi:hypothetical protein